ncbi:protein bric-a-brac 2-like isoform X7 [Eriocheir sinensis]|uniref:protein bric-a-brac 2-like isoform X7 n=1 Tax=Eriocheir sinensis TaxID=95602 RepID=UPI0021C97FA5|nr:protein bric-a-brac 2-like isoform X7 [Eriocheir sinensis]
MGADQQFCLRWNNFHSNITSAFESLRDDEDFVDITLACEGRQIKAHKMVLSACSPYFRSLLKGNPCQHPIVFLKDVTFANLTSILDFMYHGEVNVSHNELATFLKTAEALKVRGLAEDEKKKDAEGYNESSSPPPSRGEPPDPGSSPRPEEGGSAPDTHLSGDSPQPPPSKRQRRRSAASLHSAEDNTSETVLSEGQRDSSASVKNEPQDYPEDEDNMLASSAPATLEPQDLIKADLEDPDDRSFGPSDSVTISRSQAAMQQLQESFGSFLPGMGQAPSGFLPQGATDLPRPPPYPLEGVQGLPPGISALPGPSMSQGASQETGQGGGRASCSSAAPPPLGATFTPAQATAAATATAVIPTAAPGGGGGGGVAGGGAASGRGGAGAAWRGAQCPVCFKVLRDKYKLRTHVADIHSSVQHVFTCPLCFRVYKTKNTLTNHLSLAHRGYQRRHPKAQTQTPQPPPLPPPRPPPQLPPVHHPR